MRIIVVFLIVFQISAIAQDYRYGYLVEFTDKNNSPYSIDQPEEFLSERAIKRREKQNIAVTEQDLPVLTQYIDSIKKYYGTHHVTSKWLNSAVFYSDSASFESNVLAVSFVRNVSLVYEQLPAKSAKKSKWMPDFEGAFYGASTDQLNMLNAKKIHKRGYFGSGIQIAVLDAGFWRVNELSCFQYLWDNNLILESYDYISHDENVYDDHTHGMGVLSIIASNLPDELMGGGPDASFYLYRTENGFSEYPIEEENWIAGAERADSAGADIITASLGYSTYDNPNMSHTYEDMDGKTTRITRGAEIAFAKGMFIVNSAGNEGNDPWKYITAPSDGENVLCVGAVDFKRDIAFFSSVGPSFDDRIKPDVVAQGLGTALIKSDGTIGTGNGTSYSCPVITGVVASLWQALPNYTNIELLELIRSISDRYDNPDNTYGYGIPDFAKAIEFLDNKQSEGVGGDDLDKLYPNPFSKNLHAHLYVHIGGDVKINLTDLQGKIVYSDVCSLASQTYNYIELDDLNGLKSGIYILNIQTELGVITHKVIRN